MIHVEPKYNFFQYKDTVDNNLLDPVDYAHFYIGEYNSQKDLISLAFLIYQNENYKHYLDYVFIDMTDLILKLEKLLPYAKNDIYIPMLNPKTKLKMWTSTSALSPKANNHDMFAFEYSGFESDKLKKVVVHFDKFTLLDAIEKSIK